MLEKVDDGSMGFTPAVQLSFLKKKEQKEMLDAMEFAQCTPSLSQALRIKKLSADGKLTVRDMEDILSEIRSKFLKLTSSHIEYAMGCMKANTSKVHNIKKYLLATLFNAPSTISGYYQAEVNHDYPQFAVNNK